MAILKCEVCGGELQLNQDMTVGICQYCDAINIIPKDLEKKEKIYNYATHLRQNNEFDRAVRVYDDLLKEDNCNAEAHWGLLLSKLAIEYVRDPINGKMVPTCHRAQMEPILTDIDYKAAMEYSSNKNQKIYEEKAREIHSIQNKILEIAYKESPYDVFICYKELDEKNNRTEDSVLAQEIYDALAKKGYRVFFARKTLEHKLGKEFEPYIFAALNSAKTMIVVGTKREYLDSVWVRNEWSRFYQMTKKDSDKVMVIAYKNLSPYNLPDEIAMLQGQDMSVIGAMQNLCDGVERIIGSQKKSEVGTDFEKSVEQKGLNRLLRNGETYIHLDNYSLAEETYKEVTRNYPESYQGWWGLIVCKTRNFTKLIQNRSEINIWLKYVQKLCNEEERIEVERIYVSYLREIAAPLADQSVQRQINKHKNNILKIQDIIDEVLTQRECEEERCQKRLSEVDQDINVSRHNYNKITEDSSKFKKSGLCIMVAGAVITCISCFSSLWFALLIGVLICILGISKWDAGKRKWSTVKAYEQEWYDTKYRKENIIEKNSKLIGDINEKIRNLQCEIEGEQQQINELTQNFQNNKEYVLQKYLEEFCEEVEISIVQN